MTKKRASRLQRVRSIYKKNDLEVVDKQAQESSGINFLEIIPADVILFGFCIPYLDMKSLCAFLSVSSVAKALATDKLWRAKLISNFGIDESVLSQLESYYEFTTSIYKDLCWQLALIQQKSYRLPDAIQFLLHKEMQKKLIIFLIKKTKSPLQSKLEQSAFEFMDAYLINKKNYPAFDYKDKLLGLIKKVALRIDSSYPSFANLFSLQNRLTHLSELGRITCDGIYYCIGQTLELNKIDSKVKNEKTRIEGNRYLYYAIVAGAACAVSLIQSKSGLSDNNILEIFHLAVIVGNEPVTRFLLPKINFSDIRQLTMMYLLSNADTQLIEIVYREYLKHHRDFDRGMLFYQLSRRGCSDVLIRLLDADSLLKVDNMQMLHASKESEQCVFKRGSFDFARNLISEFIALQIFIKEINQGNSPSLQKIVSDKNYFAEKYFLQTIADIFLHPTDYFTVNDISFDARLATFYRALLQFVRSWYFSHQQSNFYHNFLLILQQGFTQHQQTDFLAEINQLMLIQQTFTYIYFPPMLPECTTTASQNLLGTQQTLVNAIHQFPVYFRHLIKTQALVLESDTFDDISHEHLEFAYLAAKKMQLSRLENTIRDFYQRVHKQDLFVISHASSTFLSQESQYTDMHFLHVAILLLEKTTVIEPILYCIEKNIFPCMLESAAELKRLFTFGHATKKSALFLLLADAEVKNLPRTYKNYINERALNNEVLLKLLYQSVYRSDLAQVKSCLQNTFTNRQLVMDDVFCLAAYSGNLAVITLLFETNEIALPLAEDALQFLANSKNLAVINSVIDRYKISCVPFDYQHFMGLLFNFGRFQTISQLINLAHPLDLAIIEKKSLTTSDRLQQVVGRRLIKCIYNLKKALELMSETKVRQASHLYSQPREDCAISYLRSAFYHSPSHFVVMIRGVFSHPEKYNHLKWVEFNKLLGALPQLIKSLKQFKSMDLVKLNYLLNDLKISGKMFVTTPRAKHAKNY